MSSYLLLSTLNFSLGGLVFLLGFIILRENPRQRLNRIVAMMLFFGGVGAVLAAASFLAARSGALSTAPMTRAQSTGSWPSTSTPETPSRTAVTSPPTAAATTGVPHACASRATRPKDSLWLGTATRSTAR